ncbi:MAG: WD40/YVTN/BNR-like repeat-containing protein, partial [Chitinophagales bacterium]
MNKIFQNYLSLIMICLFAISAVVNAQKAPDYTSGKQRLEAYEQRKKMSEQSVLGQIEHTNIGPTVMSGRVVDLAVNPDDPTHFYVAYASGGLWYTNSNGTTMTPVFDNQAVMTIGDIAVDWGSEEHTIWLGTGENNSSRSSYAGVGMYKSEDSGKTWSYIGLPESHHIGRIVLHPADKNIAWVGVLGHLYSSNKERGVYKTTDGGNTWEQTLFVNNETGIIDLVMAPDNNEVLYAAAWERSRRAWNFVEGGSSSGIYKSTDGGENWTLISTKDSGFPMGEGVGRIGLDIHPNGTLYAALDNQFRKEKEEEDDKDALTKDDLRNMSKSAFLALGEDKIEDYLQENGFPRKYNTKKVIGMVKAGTILPKALVEYTEDANRLLFDTPVIGIEVYRSDDGGQTWTKTHDEDIKNIYNSYGYYFGQIRVAPTDANTVYIMGVPIMRSDDGGKTFKNVNGDNVHADHHALWVNPKRAGHIINGNDGGVNISYDSGESWFKCNNPSVGQFYAINVDEAEPYNVYGGLQDNGVWVGPSTYEPSTRWHNTGDYPYDMLLGGDGMKVMIDNRGNNTVYTGFQFGFYFRVDKTTGQRTRIKPQHDLGERPLRFNWQTPIWLSKHNQDILYLGSNKLHRSMNQGDDWTNISSDLTQGGRKGDVPFGTLSTLSESDFKFGLIYTGSDDGYIHVSKDGGTTWERISDKLPQNLWVSRVEASHHKEGRVYATLNGYRWDDCRPYLFVSNNYGKTWKNLGRTLPHEPINIVREDPENENIIYVGTDH